MFILTTEHNGTVSYSFAASPAFRNIHVRGGSADGHDSALPPAGVLEGSGARALSGTSDLIVHIRKENRYLYELTKAMYQADDPLPGYRKVFCEKMRLYMTLGDSLSEPVILEAEYVLQEEWPPYWARRWRARPALWGVEEMVHCEGDVEKMLQKVRG